MQSTCQSTFYNDTAKITVNSDHLPLKKFLEKNTMNSKVNNCTVELEAQNITFEYIPGIRNTLWWNFQHHACLSPKLLTLSCVQQFLEDILMWWTLYWFTSTSQNSRTEDHNACNIRGGNGETTEKTLNISANETHLEESKFSLNSFFPEKIFCYSKLSFC